MQRRIVRDNQVSEEYVKKWEAWKRELYEIEKIPLKTLWPLFMDGVQLSQGCRTSTRRQFGHL